MKTWIEARNIYSVLSWINSINDMANLGLIDNIVYGNKPYGCKWNKCCWFNLTPNKLIIEHKSNLYWGVTITITDKNRKHVYGALKQLIYRLPITLLKPDKTFVYKHYNSKLRFIEEQMRYEPDREASKVVALKNAG